MSSYGSPLCHICAKQKIESSRREKKKSDRWNASNKMEGKLQVNPQGAFNIHANAPEGLDRASLCWNGSLFEFGYISSLFLDSSLLDSFPNQLTQLDNPAFFSSHLSFLSSLLPLFCSFFFCSFLMPRRSIRLPTCLQERLVPLLRLVFLPPPSPSSSPKPFPSTILFHSSPFPWCSLGSSLSLFLPPFLFYQKPSGG